MYAYNEMKMVIVKELGFVRLYWNGSSFTTDPRNATIYDGDSEYSIAEELKKAKSLNIGPSPVEVIKFCQ